MTSEFQDLNHALDGKYCDGEGMFSNICVEKMFRVNLIHVIPPVVNSSPEFLEVGREVQCRPFSPSFMKPISQSLIHETNIY